MLIKPYGSALRPLLTLLLCASPLVGSLALANDEQATPPTTSNETTANEPVVEVNNAEQAFLREQAPDGETQSVAQLRQAGVKPGDRVTVRAQIGGRNPPWLTGAAMMLIADAEELAACVTSSCGAPWDFCSAPQDKLLLHTGIVRWLDEAGNPRPVSFHEVADIAPLSTVIITGTVADVGDPQALVIDADSMHLAERGPFAQMMDEMKAAGTGPYQKPAQ